MSRKSIRMSSEISCTNTISISANNVTFSPHAKQTGKKAEESKADDTDRPRRVLGYNGAQRKKSHCNRPGVCFRYMDYGSNPKFGCRKGKHCRFRHPKLCNHSVRYRRCANKQCKFAHLTGTTRWADEQKWGREQPSLQRHQQERPMASSYPIFHEIRERSIHIEATFVELLKGLKGVINEQIQNIVVTISDLRREVQSLRERLAVKDNEGAGLAKPLELYSDILARKKNISSAV